MDLRKLKTLIDLVSESNVSELEITEAEGKVRIVKSAPMGVAQPVTYSMAPAPSAVVAPAAAPVDAVPAVEAPAPDAERIRLGRKLDRAAQILDQKRRRQHG